MQPVSIFSMSSLWKTLLSTNATDTSFPSRIPTTTAPNTTNNPGLVILGDQIDMPGGRPVSSHVRMCFFGVGNDDTTFDVRVIGWGKTDGGLYVPSPLYGFSCTLGTAIGIAGNAISASTRFADTVTLTTNFGTTGVDVIPTSPASNLIATVLMDCKGFSLLEVTFDMTGATSGNALYSPA